MNRYVVKYHNEWKVVNAGYKRSIKNFPTQAAAISFARNLLGTTSLMVQGRDHKFIRHYSEKDKETDCDQVLCCNVPRYVMKHSDWYEEYITQYKWRLLAISGIALILTGLIFMVLWLVLKLK